jgi:hypothetical protein
MLHLHGDKVTYISKELEPGLVAANNSSSGRSGIQTETHRQISRTLRNAQYNGSRM